MRHYIFLLLFFFYSNNIQAKCPDTEPNYKDWLHLSYLQSEDSIDQIGGYAILHGLTYADAQHWFNKVENYMRSHGADNWVLEIELTKAVYDDVVCRYDLNKICSRYDQVALMSKEYLPVYLKTLRLLGDIYWEYMALKAFFIH